MQKCSKRRQINLRLVCVVWQVFAATSPTLYMTTIVTAVINVLYIIGRHLSHRKVRHLSAQLGPQLPAPDSRFAGQLPLSLDG